MLCFGSFVFQYNCMKILDERTQTSVTSVDNRYIGDYLQNGQKQQSKFLMIYNMPPLSMMARR